MKMPNVKKEKTQLLMRNLAVSELEKLDFTNNSAYL